MQRMHVDQQHVAVAVFEFHGLVHLAVLHGPHQTAETPHAVIDMHDEVARFQFVQLRHRKRLPAVDLPAQRIPLVALEKLVIGIKTAFEPVVHKPLVQGKGKGVELHLRKTLRGENILQALDLGLVVGEDKDLVTRLATVVYIFGQQLVLLIESRLRQGIELNGTGGRQTLRIAAAQHQRFSLQGPGKLSAARHPAVDLRGIVGLGEHLSANIVHPAQRMPQIIGPPHRLAGKLRQGHAATHIHASLQIGDDLHPVELLGRELGGYVETADGLHLVAEEIDAVGLVLGKRKDVDDTAAQRILPRLVDEIHLRKSVLLQQIGQKPHLHPLAAPDRYRPSVELSRIDHLLGQSLRIGTDDQKALSVETAKGIQRRGALHDARRILLSELHGALVSGGKEHHPLLAQQRIEIVQQIGGGILVFAHEEMHPALPRHCSSTVKGIGRPRQPLEQRHLRESQRRLQLFPLRGSSRKSQHFIHCPHTTKNHRRPLRSRMHGTFVSGRQKHHRPFSRQRTPSIVERNGNKSCFVLSGP